MATGTDTFATWQHQYAEHGIATFPVKVTAEGKRPLTKGYLKTGLRGSAELARKFPDAESFGFACGRLNRVTVVDMDSTDEAIVREGERIFGPSPLLWRTGGGKFAAAFRWNSEQRRIRPISSLPIDVLGGGFVVAPPSAGAIRPYEIIKGCLADLDRLPIARVPDEVARPNRQKRIQAGERNNSLFKFCLKEASSCDSLESLVDKAKWWAERQFEDPLPDAEIVKTAGSGWSYREGRKKVIGKIVKPEVFQRLLCDIHALAVFAYLDAENGANAEFMITDTMGRRFGWPRRLVPSGRRALIELGLIERVRWHRKGVPAKYRWVTNHE